MGRRRKGGREREREGERERERERGERGEGGRERERERKTLPPAGFPQERPQQGCTMQKPGSRAAFEFPWLPHLGLVSPSAELISSGLDGKHLSGQRAPRTCPAH